MTRKSVLFAIKQGWICQNISKQLTSTCILNLTMAKKVSSNEQEQHIVRNKNV